MSSWRIIIAALAATSTTMMATADGQQWATAANNGQLMPGSDKLFNSYNQPSINTVNVCAMLVVMRGMDATRRRNWRICDDTTNNHHATDQLRHQRAS
jgi:hypothetical protein